MHDKPPPNDGRYSTLSIGTGSCSECGCTNGAHWSWCSSVQPKGDLLATANLLNNIPIQHPTLSRRDEMALRIYTSMIETDPYSEWITSNVAKKAVERADQLIEALDG